MLISFRYLNTRFPVLKQNESAGSPKRAPSKRLNFSSNIRLVLRRRQFNFNFLQQQQKEQTGGSSQTTGIRTGTDFGEDRWRDELQE